MSWFRLKACPKCRGDLASDEGDWICLQCGTYYYTGLYRYTGIYRATDLRPGPEAGGRSEEQLTQTDQGGRDAPDYPAPGREKALVWRLGFTPVVAGPGPGVAAATAHLMPSVDLLIAQQ